MAKEDRKLRVVFLPYMGALGHAIPMVHIARLFAGQGVAATIITTTNNAALFQDSIDEDAASGSEISLHTLELPADQVGLPKGIGDMGQCNSTELMIKLGSAILMLRQPMEQLIRDLRPDCIVSDMSYPWTVEVAVDLGVPRVMFYPNSVFYHAVSHSVRTYAPDEKATSDTETFVIPGLPHDHEIRMQRTELEEHYYKVNPASWYGDLVKAMVESERRSYCVILTSCYDLEPAYVEHMNKAGPGAKYLSLGPVFLFCERERQERQGKVTNREEAEIIIKQDKSLSWLDTQKPNTVLYVCFGSMARFSDPQLIEIALALEASGHPFVWVVSRKQLDAKGKTEEIENWLPDGFEERMEQGNKGLIITGWAPQYQILHHPAVGGFLSHCGWNSVLESLTADLPFISWPLYGDQFCNSKLTTQVLQVAVEIGPNVFLPGYVTKRSLVGKDELQKAITFLMGGSEEAKEMRRRAKEYGTMVRSAVEEGGSSSRNLKTLIEELKGQAFEK